MSMYSGRTGGRRRFCGIIAATAQAARSAAREACHLDRIHKTNTVKARPMSLFNQGCYR